MSLRQRLARLERASPQSTADADAVEFDRITADRPASDPTRDVARALLRGFPGCAPAFANMSMEDFRL